MSKNYFQLLYGIHSEYGKKFTAGDTIESKSDLVVIFGSNKFRRLSDDEVANLQNESEPDTAEPPKRKRLKAKRKSVA